jgi:hypothetical protein
MALDEPKYDVAISFLAADEAIAAELNRQLSGTMNVFFFPRRQEELAGTDGMESMRKPFYEDSRLMVVLFRDPWGKTRWTAIEELAIKEACFNGEWNRLFFVALDRASTLPGWLPPHYVRYNWEDFGPEQVVGVIKARVLENGGKSSPMTAMKQAELFRQEEEYRAARNSIEWQPGIPAVQAEAKALLEAVKVKCDHIRSAGHLDLDCEMDARQLPRGLGCVITNREVSLAAWWDQPYSNTIRDGAALHVREFNGPLLLPSEAGKMYFVQAKLLKDTPYKPDLFRTRELGWSLKNSNDIIPSSKMADDIVLRFLRLVEKRRTGKLEALTF